MRHELRVRSCQSVSFRLLGGGVGCAGDVNMLQTLRHTDCQALANSGGSRVQLVYRSAGCVSCRARKKYLGFNGHVSVPDEFFNRQIAQHTDHCSELNA